MVDFFEWLLDDKALVVPPMTMESAIRVLQGDFETEASFALRETVWRHGKKLNSPEYQLTLFKVAGESPRIVVQESGSDLRQLVRDCLDKYLVRTLKSKI